MRTYKEPNLLAFGIFFIILISLTPQTEPTRSLKNPPISENSNISALFADRSITRRDFPSDFIFGTASTSYQFEGAIKEDGKEFSIWDVFTHKHPAKTQHSNADIAVDFYHRYKEDVAIMANMNMDAFRFTISWSRILPYGKISSGVSVEGILFYKDLIDELVAKGLTPFASLFHWDMPQLLHEEYSGFLTYTAVEDFRDFAHLCFKLYGDKVKLWATLDNPVVFSESGYDKGKKAPGRCSRWRRNDCEGGNSSTEPYLVSHNMLLAHALVVQDFRLCEKCRGGKIGLLLTTTWFEPHSDSPDDRKAVQRAIDFTFGWFLDPITHGEYPDSMKNIVGNRLPSFTDEQKKMLIKSYDYIGINYYGAKYVANVNDANLNKSRPSYISDKHVAYKYYKNGVPIGPKMASSDYVYPQGIRYIVNYTKDHYNNPPIYITENGFARFNDSREDMSYISEDLDRIDYHQNHLSNLSKAVNDYGVNVKGYFVWSLMDNFHWSKGYNLRFGLYSVDFEKNLTRKPKLSAMWFEYRVLNDLKQSSFSSLNYGVDKNTTII